MADENPALAVDQVTRIEKLCDYMEANKAALDSVPVSMPHEPGSKGFDIPLWAGLGTVGLWGAVDAFAERGGLQSKCPICGRKCIVQAYKSMFQPNQERSFAELEDLRHLYAHNYAGKADDKYFKHHRHVLRKGVRERLSCGAIFDGWRLCREDDIPQHRTRLPLQYALNLSDLRNYSGIVRTVLQRSCAT